MVVVALMSTAAIAGERVMKRIIARGTTCVVSILAGPRTSIVTRIDINIDINIATDVGISIVINVGISIGAGTDIVISVIVIGIDVVALAKAKGLVIDIRRVLAIAFFVIA